MATQSVKLKDVKIPNRRDYVRGTVDKKNLADLLIVAKDPKHRGWPFRDPIILRRFAKPTKDGKLYGVVDGVTRCTVYKILHRPTVEADIKTLTDKESAVLQFTSNIGHGIRLNRKARNNWVKHMRFDLGMKLAEIAREVGMTETSVSRMARDKQIKAGPRKPMERKAATGKPSAPAPAPRPVAWTVTDCLSRIKLLGAEILEHPEALRVYARQHSREIVKLCEPVNELLNAALAVEASAAAKA